MARAEVESILRVHDMFRVTGCPFSRHPDTKPVIGCLAPFRVIAPLTENRAGCVAFAFRPRQCGRLFDSRDRLRGYFLQ